MFLASSAGRGGLWKTAASRRSLEESGTSFYRLLTTTRTGSKKPPPEKPATPVARVSQSHTQPLDGPRRLLVKRKKGATVSSHKHEKVGVVKRHSPKAAVVRDSAGQTIYVSSSSSSSSSTTGRASAAAATSERPYQATPTGTFRRTQRLPLINASAILDRKVYCVQSASAATSKSGTGAARRLLQGKKDLCELLRQQLKKAYRRGPPASYVLQGHGIPVQLLQHFLDFANAVLLHNEDAAECSFHNHHHDNNDSDAHSSLEWMRVRSKEGTNRATPWPVREEWDESMQLYLATQHRLARELSVALHPTSASASASSTASSSDENDDDHDDSMDDYDNTFAPTHSFSPLVPRHTNVEFLRGLYYPPSMLPSTDNNRVDSAVAANRSAATTVVTPIVEWTPLEGIAAPGHVCIRLQGFPSLSAMATTPDAEGSVVRRRKKRQAVTLCFDACFRNES